MIAPSSRCWIWIVCGPVVGKYTSVAGALNPLSAQAQLLTVPQAISADLARYSRRDLLRRLGAAAALVPAVMTILAPAASAAGSDTCTGTFGMCMHRNCPSGLACRNLHPSGNECGCV